MKPLISFSGILPALLLSIQLAAGQTQPGATPDFVFKDICESSGLQALIDQIQAHAAAWGDVNGDGTLDLFVGSYYRDLRDSKQYMATKPPVPGRLYYNRDGKFVHDPASGVEILMECSFASLADLDNDGDLDLFLSIYCARNTGTNRLFENDGRGRFAEVTGRSAWISNFVSRTVAIFDYDRDGRLDLFMTEGDRPGKHSRLFRNMDGLAFKDVTADVGLPSDISGLGVASGDITGNGWPSLYVAGDRSNRLFLNEKGKFREIITLKEVFRWDSPNNNPDDMPCGVCFGDVNNDGRLDIVVGHHYDSPWKNPERIRLYLNLTEPGKDPVFREIGKEAGLTPLPTKAPVVEIRDFDNDGLPDIHVAIVVRDDAGLYPVIFKNLGVTNGLPHFRERALARVDFPRPEHARMSVHQLVTNTPVRYFGVGPSSDFNRDGRLDFVLPAWWPRLNSLLMINETAPENRWLTVQVKGKDKVNRMGIGSKVTLYPVGARFGPETRLAFQEIAIGYGYSGSQEAVAHFGLGKIEQVNMVIELTDGKKIVRSASANQRIIVSP